MIERSYSPIISKKNVVHIIGGGGVGMSGLARLLLKLGYKVTASDAQASRYLTKLNFYGVKTWVGSHPQKIASNSVIFYSTAIPESDLERRYAQRNQIPIYSRRPLLHFLTQQFYTIAVSGTHGKTTTSAWLTFLLRKANFDPTALLGGSALNFEDSFISGKGTINGKPLLVIEADESDNSFLNLVPQIAVVTNIEMDHPDQHGSLESIHDSFLQFISKTIEGKGRLISSIESTETVENLKSTKFMPANKNILKKIKLDSINNTIEYEGEYYKVRLRGVHNLYNATCIISLSELFGIGRSILRQTLIDFEGVARRMHIIYKKEINQIKSLTVMDDYAHHPQEVMMTLQTLTKEYDYCLVVWEPHRISRFCYFFSDFYNVFQKYCGWDRLILMPTFYAGDKIEDFSDYHEKLNKFQSKSINKDNKKINYEPMYRLLQHHGHSIVVFLGAGNSSHEAHSFSEFCKIYNA